MIQKDKYLFIIFIVSILFFPLYNYFHLYFIFNIGLLLLLSIIYKINISKPVKVVVILSLLYILGRFFNWFDSGELYVRDSYELARLFIIILVLSLLDFFKKVELKFILLVLSVYVVFDFTISILQFLHIDFNNIVYNITKFYSSVYHFNSSYFGIRVNGISSGPGQHGTTLVFMYILFFISYLLSNEIKKKTLYLVISILSLGSIIFAQSKTAILTIIIINIVILFWAIYIKNKKIIKSLLFVNSFVLIGIVALFFIFYQKFQNILQMLDKGINIPSYELRLNSYYIIIEKANENIQYWLLGYGKAYFGSKSGNMDSEILFFLTVYGLLFSAILFFYLSKFIFMVIKYREELLNLPINIILLFMLIGGLIMGYTSGFFIHPLNLVLFGIIFIKAYNENITFIRS